MLLLHAFFLWLMASTLIIGGAVVFHRRYPEESPWFGFILPPLALVILLNFIEHGIALPVLFIFLPVLLAGTVWLIAVKKWFAQPLVLPTVVFLISFAFTFGIRCLRPDILSSSDGISDLNMVNNYSQGQTLPPPDTWMPPFRFEWYYGLQHYAASVLERLLNVKIGEAYNVSHALLSALICVTAAGAAWRISGGRTWITLAVPFIIESAMTGSSAYLLLTSTNPSVDLFPDPSGGMIHPPDKNPLWAWLFSDLPATLQNDPAKIPDFQTLRLQVPGFWTWRDEYHANASGHFFTILSVLAVAELVEPRKTIWPWVVAILTPLLAVVASAWALPITTLLCWPAILIALLCGRRPAATGTALLTLFVALTLLWPAFNNATSSPELPHVEWIKPLEHVPPLRIPRPVVAHPPPLDWRLRRHPRPLLRPSLVPDRHSRDAHRHRTVRHRKPLQRHRKNVGRHLGRRARRPLPSRRRARRRLLPHRHDPPPLFRARHPRRLPAGRLECASKQRVSP